jgi:hypothetical protein
MTTIKSIFFDIGDTLGTAVLSPPPIRLIRLDLFPYVTALLRSLVDRGLRLGIISNTGDMDGASVDEILNNAGIRDFFDPSLRLYSKDVGLEKDSPEIFRLAVQRAGLAGMPQACLFVGEEATERGFAIDAGLRACPHPLLVNEVLDDQPLRFVRVTAPPATSPRALRATLRAQPLVALHVAGENGNVIYAMASQRTATALMNMQLKVDLLGNADQPARTDLYLLRDDVAVQSGFLSPRGEAARFFGQPATSGLLVGSGADGVIVALPDGQSPGDFHFAEARHGHTLKLLPDPLLLDDPPVGHGFAAGQETPVDFSALTAALDPTVMAALAKITPAAMIERIERYSGVRPLSGTDPVRIRSRHLANLDGDNQRVVAALADELEKIGQGRLKVRLVQFSHRGISLHNVEAELAGQSPELVLVTAHLDSTAADDSDFDEAHGAAPGADDDASGVAAVLAAAEQFVALSAAAPLPRTVRFVLFNAEEEGLVGSRVYARQQKAAGSRIVAVLQMDMIGFHKVDPRSWEVHAGFAPSAQTQARSVTIAKVVQSVAPIVSPRLDQAQIYDTAQDPAAGRSDHAPFQDQGYPACVVSEDFFFGPSPNSPQPQANPNYHRASDTFVDGEFAADLARAVAASAWVISAAGVPAALAFARRATEPDREMTMPQREFDSRKHHRGATDARATAVSFGISDAAPRGIAMASPLTFGPSEPEAAANPVPAQPAGASLVSRALAFARTPAVMAFAGGGGGEPSGFFADPVPQVTSSGAATVHLHQQYRGLTIFQMARAVRFNTHGQTIDAIGETSPIPADMILAPVNDVSEAVAAAARHLASTGGGQSEKDKFGQTYALPQINADGFKPTIIASFPLPSRPTVLDKGPFENPIPAYLLIFGGPDGPRLAWHSVLTFPNYEEQYVVIVSADDRPGEILYSKSTLHKAKARGNVFEFSPGIGPRQLIEFPRAISDYPAMPTAPLAGFPADWIDANQAVGNTTRATLNFTTTTLSGKPGTDPVEFNPAEEFGDEQKLLNIFYFCNYMHDFLYIVGFDEAAGNFQQVNFTHTGLGNDPVLARAHSQQVTGTANMSTGPDGRPPVMNMGLVSGPRHTAFDADVVFHEYTHGLTNRLVGGLMQGHALDEPQSSGMGEGWSDFFALTVQNFHRAKQGQKEKVVVGDWVVDQPGGIRTAPYDDAYPVAFGGIGGMADEHDVGEVWCAALMMMARRIRAIVGDLDGYRLSWTMVVDGLKLTPANPSFLDARDAILLALDHLRDRKRLAPDVYKRVRRAAWESFARFEMGVNAKSPSADLQGIVGDNSLPPDL